MSPAVLLRDAVSMSAGFPLLAGITFEVAEGESVHLRGPNGAGKTSLLRACAGLLPISAGEATVLGHDLRLDRESLRREVGLLGHAGSLYDDLTVEENVRFAVRAARGDASSVAGALARLDLAGRLARTRVGKLSAGQRRRTALAALVARRPRLWLLDEPHAGLDEAGRAVLDELVAELHGEGATVLIASHELERAAALADRVVSIAGGHVVAERRGERQSAAPERQSAAPERQSAAPEEQGAAPEEQGAAPERQGAGPDEEIAMPEGQSETAGRPREVVAHVA
jgi:heme ABC exporter ATP-binding subunit CcmA